MNNKIYKFAVGDKACMKMVATDKLIRQLAEISGDINPIHLSEEYAKTTVFKSRIAHGLFCLGMISNLIGNKLPGEGAIFVSEDLKYKNAVFINDEIETCVEIADIIPKRSILIMNVKCENQNDETVLEGVTVVKVV